LFDNRLIRELFLTVKAEGCHFPPGKRWVFKKVYNTVKLGARTYFSMVFFSIFESIGAFGFVEQEHRSEAQ
jgi:hypothetical protein